MQHFNYLAILLFFLLNPLWYAPPINAQACGTAAGEFCEGFDSAEEFFAMGHSVQTSIVPPGTKSIKIRAIGGDGGEVNTQGSSTGATVIGTFSVSAGQVLEIQVGEGGESVVVPFGNPIAAGGGGGSGVRIGSDNSNILVVAGGGGGSYTNEGFGIGGGGGGASSIDGVGIGAGTAGGDAGNNLGCGGFGVLGGGGFGSTGAICATGGGSNAGAGGAGAGDGGAGGVSFSPDAAGGGGGGGYSGGGAGISTGGAGGGGGSFATTTNSAMDVTITEGLGFFTGTGDDGSVCLCYSSDPVPVELVSFKGFATSNGVQLQWQTASERDNEGFEVERSFNSKEWKQLGFVVGNGTSIATQNYNYLDTDLGSNKTHYYRLKQVDFDGQSEYSKVIAVHPTDSKQEILNIFPNPVTQKLYYDISDMDVIEGVELYDIYGKLVKVAQQIDGQLSLEELNTGTYILVLKTPQAQLQQLVVKQ